MFLKTLALIAGIGGVLASSSEKFFRHDYVYNEVFAAFYKVHSADKSRAWDEAFVTCDDEGAKLFYTDDLNERTAAGNLTESMTDIEEIFVGVRDEFGLGDFVSIEGRLIPELSRYADNGEVGESKCVVMSVRTGVYSVASCKNKRPFICKRVDNETCPTVDSAYVYSTAAKKCYKVNRRAKIWSEALHTCLMEGGILATLTKDIVKTVLRNFMDSDQSYFIGARKILPHGSFYDTQGSMFELMEDRRNDNNNCKVLRIQSNDDSKYVHSYDCNTTLPFICEMHI